MSQPSRLEKLIIGIQFAYAHKSIPNFEEAATAERDECYEYAASNFAEYHEHLKELIIHFEEYRLKMKEAIGTTAKLSKDFMSMSRDQHGSDFQYLKSMASERAALLGEATENSAMAVEKILFGDSKKFLLNELTMEKEKCDKIVVLIRERFQLKMELHHYSTKISGIVENHNVAEDRKIRNGEKLLIARARFTELTRVLMQKLYDAEIQRKYLLEVHLPEMMELQRTAYMIIATNAERAMKGIVVAPTKFTQSVLCRKTPASRVKFGIEQHEGIPNSSTTDQGFAYSKSNVGKRATIDPIFEYSNWSQSDQYLESCSTDSDQELLGLRHVMTKPHCSTL